jgi:hypothetical protein
MAFAKNIGKKKKSLINMEGGGGDVNILYLGSSQIINNTPPIETRSTKNAHSHVLLILTA